MRRTLAAALLLGLGLAAGVEAGTVVFHEPGFPAVESEAPSRETLAAALAPLAPTFVGLEELRKPETLRGADLLVLPYGSAFPADAWGALRAYLEGGGNLLNLGGRPLWVPAFREGTGFRLGPGGRPLLAAPRGGGRDRGAPPRLRALRLGRPLGLRHDRDSARVAPSR